MKEKAGHQLMLRTALRQLKSKCQFPGREVVLRRNAECIGDAVEESEQGCNIDRLGNLSFFPPCQPQLLDIFRSRPVGSVGNEFHVVEEGTLRWRKARFVKLAFNDCFYTLIGCSLNPQEVGMAVQSIRTAVQKRNVAGDHLFVATRKMTFREMNRVS
jgi:hypothetical protein